jgi:hypothetical protein
MRTKPINPTTLSNETIATNYQEPTRTGPLLALWEQAATKRPLTAQGGSNNMEKQRNASETKTAIYSTTKTAGKTNKTAGTELIIHTKTTTSATTLNLFKTEITSSDILFFYKMFAEIFDQPLTCP